MTKEQLEARKAELSELIDQADLDDDGNLIQVHEPSALLDYINELNDEYWSIVRELEKLG